MIAPIIFILLNYNTFELYDYMGYDYLLQYEPEIIYYKDLKFGVGGRSKFYKSRPPRTDAIFYLNYKQRYYSRKTVYFFTVEPRPSFYRNGSNNAFNFDIGIRGNYKYYPITDYFFTSIGVNFRNIWRWRDSYKYSRISGEFRLGFGVGRIIPIMPIYLTLKIEQELKDLGMLKSSLSREELEGIADLLSRKAEYDDPRNFWRDLESVITGLEQFKGDKLGAIPTIRIDRILSFNPYIYRETFTYFLKRWSEEIFPVGINIWERGRGFEGKIYVCELYKKSFLTSHYDDESNKIFIGTSFNYSHPLSRKLQFSFHSLAEVFFKDSIDWRKADIGASLTYELFDRMLAYWEFKYDGMSQWLSKTSLGCIYYIDYKMAFNIRGEILYSSKRKDFNGKIFVGFNYLFF